MFKTNLILAYRSLIKEKGFSLINILGLAIGLACFLLLTVYVIHEHSYEKFRPDYDRIYRIYQHGAFRNDAENVNWGYMPYKSTAHLLQDFPEIEQVTTVDVENGFVMTYKDKFFIEWRCLVGDSSFYDMFPAEFIYGNADGSLDGPHKIVLTEAAAKKWFGDENPVGKMVQVTFDENPFEITGVVKNPRSDTHIRYDMLISDQSLKYGDNNTWWRSRWRMNYIKVKPGVNIADLEEKLQKLMEIGLYAEFEENFDKSLDEVMGDAPKPTYKMQALQDIYKNPKLSYELLGLSANPTLMLLSIIIAISILLLACINYVNLATARASNRIKEICIKKVSGAEKSMLIMQFLGESFIITTIAIFLGLSLTELFMESFCDMLTLEFVIHIFNIPYIIPFLITLLVVVSIAAGIYPAFIMSSTNVVSGLKSTRSTSSRNVLLRKVLVSIQFIISFVIVLGAFVVKSQLNYIESDNKGYSKNNLVILHNFGQDIPKEKWFSFKETVKNIPGVLSASLTSTTPAENAYRNSAYMVGDTTEQQYNFVLQLADNDFLNTMDITLLEGRGFYNDTEYDTLSCIVNETAIKEFHLDDPYNKYFNFHTPNLGDRNLKIVGVVKDYHVLPVYKKIDPLIIFQPLTFYERMIVRFTPEQEEQALTQIKDLWRKYSGGKNVHSERMQDALDWQYRAEISANKVVTVFSFISVLIASLGLIGLVAYSSIKRTKEIGIRKAIGAKVPQIIFLLSKETVILISISVLVALPIAYYLIQMWLEKYIYHVEIQIIHVISATVILFLIALLSEFALTIRVARKNPVESLRYE